MRPIVVSPAIVMSPSPVVRGLRGLGLLLLLVELLDGLDLLFQLHPPVLEPDFDLPFGEAQLVRHLDPSPPGEVMVRVEFLLQLQGLVPRVRLAAAAPEAARPSEQVSTT